MDNELINKWEASGLLEYHGVQMSYDEKCLAITMFEGSLKLCEADTMLNKKLGISGMVFLPAVARLFYKHKTLFDIKHTYNEMCNFLNKEYMSILELGVMGPKKKIFKHEF